ncbi:MAG: hypothetical protein HRU01_03125 [Myxococcales bacterium]|nr:hypothetical protein [Myxococcales bacterium]
MDGRRPTGVMYVNTHVDDPNKEIEYDAWYRNVHFPDVTEPGMFVNATMFHNANVPPATGEGKFLAFYETYWEDVGAATDAFRGWVDVLGRESRIHAGTLGASFGIYANVARRFATERRRFSQSVNAFLIDPREGAPADDVRRHLVEHTLAAVAGIGLHHSVSVGELTTSQAFADATGEQARFLLLLESDIGDPRALATSVEAKVPDAVPDTAELRIASNFFRGPVAA